MKELQVLSTLLKLKASPYEALKVVLGHHFAPNLIDTPRILLTLPATVGSGGERSI